MDSDEMREMVGRLKENSRYMIEVVASIAKTNRAYYEECISQGFSAEEALELVKVHGITMTGK